MNPLGPDPVRFVTERTRAMTQSDLPDVLATEQRVYSHPWSLKNFKDCLAGNYECWVLRDGPSHLGHAVISTAAGESQLLNLSIDSAFQRQGMGRALLRFVVDRARARNAQVMFLEVRMSNTAAQLLYFDEGFSEVGLRKGYYPASKQREDALILGIEL